MNQTEHYKLSQWEPSDRVQMEDFNGDNAKLEAALSRKLELVKLFDITENLPGEDSTWTIPLDKDVMSRAVAVFFSLQLQSNDHYLSLGRGSPHLLTLKGMQISAALFLPGIPGMQTCFVPLDGHSTQRTGYALPAELDSLIVTINHSTERMIGQHRCIATAIL